MHAEPRKKVDPKLNIYTMAEALCKEYGLDWKEQYDYFKSYGYIFSTPNAIALAEVIPYHGENHWCCFMLIGKNSIPMFLNMMPFWCNKIMFARLTRNRHNLRPFDTERICKKFHVDPKPLKKRLPDDL